MEMRDRRRFYAEEIQACANLHTRALVDALATVPREQFLRPGPWAIRSETDMGSPMRETPDADPRHVYHNLSIGIDPGRMLFNGAPGVVAMGIDALALRPGQRVLHVGSGLGYYTAVMAEVVGASGRVVAIEVDPTLATEAARNLAPYPAADVRHGDGTAPRDDTFDAVLVNAGTTHPHESWLTALPVGGRLVFPLTASMPQMGPIGKGPMILLTRSSQDGFDARMLTFVAIYSAIGLRDDAINAALGKALARAPFGPFKRLRRDAHQAGPSCWLHGATFCLSSD